MTGFASVMLALLLFAGTAGVSGGGSLGKHRARREEKPRPRPCLTSGCTKLTIAYDLSSAATGIYNATQGRQVHDFHDQSATVASHADPTGYFLMSGQGNFLNGGGMQGCYDPSQEPAPDQLRLLAEIVSQLKQNYYWIPNFFWTVIYTAPSANCLNSSSRPDLRTVFFYTSIGNALRWDRDAIAAIMAHEVGHLTDQYCGVLGQNIVATAGQTVLQQVCEKHADNIGIQYVVGAGFNPNGFVNTFQTLQQFAPTSVSMRYSANHPINTDRVRNVRLALEELCSRSIPGACQYVDAATPDS